MLDTLVGWLGGEAKTVAFAVLSGVAAFVAKGVYELSLARRKDKLERVNQQLRLLYGPLFALVNVSTITWRAFVDQYCENPSFRTPGGIAPQTPEAEKIWRHWMENVFMPLNAQMAQLVTQNADLLEEEQMPDCLLRLSAHVHGYAGVLAAWKRLDYSRHMSLTPFPVQNLYHYATETYQKLKARQAGLIGRRG